jgi:hypothetical protein
MDIDKFTDDVMLLRYKLNIEKQSDIRLVFNTPYSCSVWVDGSFCFARDGGRMAPSAHRAPKDQRADITLDAGEHEVIASIDRPSGAKCVEWVIVAADAKTHQWIPDAFIYNI